MCPLRGRLRVRGRCGRRLRRRRKLRDHFLGKKCRVYSRRGEPRAHVRERIGFFFRRIWYRQY
jgi:hypothetical protein